jgi:lambda family phage tail tape measure protein
MAEETVSIVATIDDRLTKPMSGFARLFASIEARVTALSAKVVPLGVRLAALGNVQMAAVGRSFASVLGGFRGLKNEAGNLSNKLTPLTRQFAGLVAVVASAAAFKGAIAAAERQVNAEQRLLQALKGSRTELERIKIVATDIQNLTIRGDEEMIEIAALLVNAGVSANKLEKAMRATVDTATALDQPMESVAKSIAQFEQGRAGLLARLVPELRDLEESGRLAANGLDLLSEKFSGVGRAVAATPFGRATQAVNALGDAAEVQGFKFVRIKELVFKGLTSAVDQLSRSMDGTFGRVVFRAIEGTIEGLSKLIPFFVKLGLVIGGIKLSMFLYPFLIFATKVAAITAGIYLIGAGIKAIYETVADTNSGIGDINTSLDGTKEKVEGIEGAFATVSGSVKDIAKALSTGSIDFSDLFDIILTKAKQVYLYLRGYLFEPVANFIIGLGSVVGTSGLEILRIVANVVKYIVNVIEFAIRGVIDTVTGLVADFLAKIPGVSVETANAVRTSLSADTNEGFKAAVANAKQAEKDISQSFSSVKNSFTIALEEGKAAFKNTMIEIDNEEKALAARLAARDAARQKADIDKFRENQKEKKEDLSRAIREQARLEESLANLIARRNEAAIRSDAEIKLKALDSSLDARLISFEEYLKQRRELELAGVEPILASTREQIKLVEDQIRQMKEGKEGFVDVRLQLEQLIQLRRQEQEIATQVLATDQALVEARRSLGREVISDLNKQSEKISDTIEKVQQLSSVRAITASVADARLDATIAAAKEEAQKAKGLLSSLLADPEFANDLKNRTEEVNKFIADLEKSTLDARRRLAEDVISGLNEQRSKTAEAVQEAKDLYDSGVITFTESQERAKAAVLRTRDAAVEAKEALKLLLEGDDLSPELKLKLLEIDEVLRSVQDKVKGTFSTGFSTGLRQAVDDFDDLAVAGTRLGETVGSSLTGGIENFFQSIISGSANAKTAFKQFAASLLSDLASMIIKMLVFRAISAAIGAFSGGAGGAGIIPGAGGAFGSGMGLASGGPVPGPDVRRDVIPAMLMPNEWVIRRDASRYYGDAIMSALNNRLIPRSMLLPFGTSSSAVLGNGFADGGRAYGTGSSGSPAVAFVVPDEQSLERLLSGGTNSMMRWMEEHASQLSAVLGQR